MGKIGEGDKDAQKKGASGRPVLRLLWSNDQSREEGVWAPQAQQGGSCVHI